MTVNALLGEVAKAIVGKHEVLINVAVSILANGHILFEDFPGLAKTLMANTFANALGCTFKRIQFTPDLLPADITGTYIFDEKDNEFKFRPGPIFTNILLADEINRAPPKTQAALLEAMQERQVTIEGVTHKLPRPFIVLATQNPIEQEGTYPLPEAQLDRFMMKMSVGYPNRAEEKEILIRRQVRQKDNVDVEVVTNPKKIVEMQQVVERVHVDPALLTYMVEIVTRTREDPRVLVGSSPRGSLALFKLARARAVIAGRDFMVPDDVKYVFIPGLAHRLILKPEPRIRGVLPSDICNKILQEVPVPAI
ncbi:MAG: MoxR family ATPase [Thermoplasmata archaeon]